MLATCLEVRYEEGEFYLSQQVKKGTRTKYKNGYTHSPRGFGWGDTFKPSRLILYIEVDGQRGYSWIDRYFKDTVGRLTEKRRKKIISTMPSTVKVEEIHNSNGEKYYVVSDADMDSWLSKTGL